MNNMGDGEDHPAFMAPDVPRGAPVAADMWQAPTADPYPSYSAVPLQAGRAPASAPPALDQPPGLLPATAGTGQSPPARQARSGAEPPPEDVSPPTTDQAVVGRGGHDYAPESLAHAEYLITGSPPGEPPEDPNRVIVRKQLDALRLRAANAASWLEASAHYARLINREGTVPVTARFTRDDIEFLGRAREEVLGLAELGLRLLELHAPLDAGGISTDPSSPILRCRSCMWRWPCPTFSVLGEAISQLPHPGAPPAR